MALELSEKKGQVAFSDGAQLRRRTVAGGDELGAAVAAAREERRSSQDVVLDL